MPELGGFISGLGKPLIFVSYVVGVLLIWMAIVGKTESWKRGRMKPKQAEVGKPPTGNRPWPLPDDGYDDWRDKRVEGIHVVVSRLTMLLPIALFPILFG
jgi:hypothetical protein